MVEELSVFKAFVTFNVKDGRGLVVDGDVGDQGVAVVSAMALDSELNSLKQW